MSNSIKDRLKEEMKRRGVKTPALSYQTGIPKDRIYGWYRDNTNPKAEDQAILEKWLAGETSTENEEMPNNVSRSTVSHRNIPDFPGSELLKAITTLTESNKGLVDSNRSITDTNRVIADTNAILAQKLIKEDSTAGAPSDNPLTDPATLKVLLDALAVVGSGEHPWRSKEEGVAVLNSQILKLSGEVGKKPGTQTGADRLSTGKKAQ